MKKNSDRLSNNNHTKIYGSRALGRTAGLAGMLILALMTGGCLVSNEEYNEASRKREEYSQELTRLHQANDLMKREVTAIYESCDLISTQLTVLAAMSIHDKFTDGLARARPVLPPPIATGSTSRQSTQGQGVTTTRGQGAGQSTGGRTGSSGSRPSRPSSGGQGGRTGGGTSTPPASPPPSSPGGGGSIDWGF